MIQRSTNFWLKNFSPKPRKITKFGILHNNILPTLSNDIFDIQRRNFFCFLFFSKFSKKQLLNRFYSSSSCWRKKWKDWVRSSFSGLWRELRRPFVVLHFHRHLDLKKKISIIKNKILLLTSKHLRINFKYN